MHQTAHRIWNDAIDPWRDACSRECRSSHVAATCETIPLLLQNVQPLGPKHLFSKEVHYIHYSIPVIIYPWSTLWTTEGVHKAYARSSGLWWFKPAHLCDPTSEQGRTISHYRINMIDFESNRMTQSVSITSLEVPYGPTKRLFKRLWTGTSTLQTLDWERRNLFNWKINNVAETWALWIRCSGLTVESHLHQLDCSLVRWIQWPSGPLDRYA